jgi:hypothetical protein
MATTYSHLYPPYFGNVTGPQQKPIHTPPKAIPPKAIPPIHAPKALSPPKPTFLSKYGLLLRAIAFLGVSASGFYFFEKGSWPDLTFGDSLWWSLVTSMTVGYGDVYPKTWQGRWLVAAPTILLGIGLLAHTFGVIEKEGKLSYIWKTAKTPKETAA